MKIGKRIFFSSSECPDMPIAIAIDENPISSAIT